jgi:hypothetical protein
MPNESNLVPIKPGQQLALKPPEDRKSEIVKARVTQRRKEELESRARDAGLSLSDYILQDK